MMLIHVVACSSVSVLSWWNNIPLRGYAQFPTLHPSVMDSRVAAANMYVQVWGRHMFSVLLGRYLGMQSLGHTVNLCVTLGETAGLSSKASLYSPTSHVRGSQLLHVLVDTRCHPSF